MTVSNEEALRRMVMDLHTENARLHAELACIRDWAAMTEHGSAAAEVLLLIRDLADAATLEV